MKTKLFLAITTFLLVGITSFSQVGIGTKTPDTSSLLDLSATDKGFLPPRMTTVLRDQIPTPAQGLVIFNTNLNCLDWWTGSSWYNPCTGTSSVTIPGNATCAGKTISRSSCSTVSGATINDDAATVDGVEYDWSGATGLIAGGTTRALVEINGQCWYRRNADNIPTAYDPAPAWVNGTENGWSGYYTGGPHTNEGRLYQWIAAMNGQTTERAQGVCPTGWHVPSDCEWMYMEYSLGMPVDEHETNGFFRNTGNVGSKLSALTSAATNSSGFTALLSGTRLTSGGGAFSSRGSQNHTWSSTPINTSAFRRYLQSTEAGVFRGSVPKARGLSVRCIKD